LFADRLGFQEVDSLHQAGEFVSEFTRYPPNVQNIRGNRWKTGERISHRNESKINDLCDIVIETNRERDDECSQFEGAKTRCRSKLSFLIQPIVVTAIFPLSSPFPRFFTENTRALANFFQMALTYLNGDDRHP
jgi:hypothetical protein